MLRPHILLTVHILRIHQAALQNAASPKKGNLLALLVAITVVCSAKLATLLKSDGIPTMRVDPPDSYRFLSLVDSRASAPFRARGSSPSTHDGKGGGPLHTALQCDWCIT